MIRFNNDYNRGAMPEVMQALGDLQSESFAGYGEDLQCDKAAAIIRRLTECESADVRFFPGATQANFIVIAAALDRVQSVISADTGHINCHEAASIENTGHKVLALPNLGGKLTAAQVADCAEEYRSSGGAEYLTEPKLVYISFPTEQGTLYSLSELEAISAVCREYGMYLFVDGARMSYGLASEANDVTLPDLARLADVFYLGGTKCGALFGEAVVITDDSLKPRFKAYMKQSGAVLAKGWLLGAQFCAMLESGAYFSCAKRADALAMRIRRAFEAAKVPLWADSFTNQQFVILTDEQKRILGEKYIFEESGRTRDGTVCRFCTSWATTDDEVKALIADIEQL